MWRLILVYSWYYMLKLDKSKCFIVVWFSKVDKCKNYYFKFSRIKRKVVIVDNIVKLFGFIVILKCVMIKKVKIRYLFFG